MKILFLNLIVFCFTAQAQAKILNVALTDPPSTLDWNDLMNIVEAPIAVNLAEGLFSWNPGAKKLESAAAESVSKNKALTEYTFKIAKTAKWSDGRAVYAQDFVDSWARLISPQNASLYNYYLFDVVNAEEFHQRKIDQIDQVGFKAIDDQTLVVKLKHPDPRWETRTAFWPLFPVRKDKIAKYGNNWSKAGLLVGNGAYVLDSYEVGKEMVLKKNTYYLANPGPEEVHLHFSLDSEKTLASFKSGFFPFIHASRDTGGKNLSGYRELHSLKAIIMTVNAKKFPMMNKAFREAIFQSIDLKEITKAVEAYHLAQATNLIPPELRPSPVTIMPEYSPEKAKKALTANGYVRNSKGGKLKVLARLIDPFPQIGKVIKEQLAKNLGIAVELSTLRSGEFSTYAALQDYDLLLTTWYGKTPEPQDFLLPYSPSTPNSRLIFNNSFYSQWIREGVLAEQPKEAFKAFDRAQKLYIQEESVVYPLFFEQDAYYLGPQVKNIDFDYMGFPLLKTFQFK